MSRRDRARLLFASLLVVPSLGSIPSTAAADACPSADTSYMSNCGPEFSVPNWADAGGWTDPSQYSTISSPTSTETAPTS